MQFYHLFLDMLTGLDLARRYTGRKLFLFASWIKVKARIYDSSLIESGIQYFTFIKACILLKLTNVACGQVFAHSCDLVVKLMMMEVNSNDGS